MKKVLVIALVSVVSFAATQAIVAAPGGVEKVIICHKGNTITVAETAWPAHLAHGDLHGACPG